MRSIIALLVLPFVVATGVPDDPAAASQPGVIHGTVTDATNGQPLPGASVWLDGTSKRTTSMADGTYRLEDVEPGTYDVVASYVGFQRRQVPDVQIGAEEERRLDIALRPSTGRAEEVSVRSDAMMHGISGQTLKAAPSHGWNPPPGWNTEDYGHIEENAWKDARAHPLSTFSVDTDGASYSNVRRFITDASHPPRDAVRIEELVNYFSYDYPDPVGEHPFAVVTEVGPAPWKPAHRLVHVGLQGRRMDESERPSSNLVFLLDVSGSMGTPRKLPLVKQAFEMLVEQLGPEDRVAIVVYAGASGLVLPSTPGSERGEILGAIQRLESGGTTAGAAGIRQAYQVAQEHFIEGGNNRVVLATDGDFNIGVSSDAELVQLIEEKREEGTFLTVLGFGTGNLKDNKMEQLANHGNGSYYYLDSRHEAEKVLVRELGSTLFTIAKDVKVQVEFNPARVKGYRLIGYENRMLAAEDFADDAKDAGELGAGHSVTALYEVIPVGAETDVEVRVPDDLRYQQPADPDVGSESDELLFVKLRYKQPDSGTSILIEQPLEANDADAELSPDFQHAAAVAAFGMILRDSEHRGDATLDQVLALADEGLAFDPHGDRAGFIQLVHQYRRLVDDADETQASR